MNVVNIYDATESLQRAYREVLGAEHESDRQTRELYGIEPDMDIMLLEHDRPNIELFPNKDNQKKVESRFKGNTLLSEVKDLADS